MRVTRSLFRIKGFLVPSHHNAFLCKSERQNNKKEGLSSILISDIFINVENGLDIFKLIFNVV